MYAGGVIIDGDAGAAVLSGNLLSGGKIAVKTLPKAVKGGRPACDRFGAGTACIFRLRSENA